MHIDPLARCISRFSERQPVVSSCAGYGKRGGVARQTHRRRNRQSCSIRYAGKRRVRVVQRADVITPAPRGTLGGHGLAAFYHASLILAGMHPLTQTKSPPAHFGRLPDPRTPGRPRRWCRCGSPCGRGRVCRPCTGPAASGSPL